jgi:hypothetical protein
MPGVKFFRINVGQSDYHFLLRAKRREIIPEPTGMERCCRSLWWDESSLIYVRIKQMIGAAWSG